MFELAILVGLGATVLCFLKGHVRSGLIAAGLGAVAVGIVIVRAASTESDMGDTATGVIFGIGGLLWTAAAVVLALPAARPGSAWERRGAVDAAGNRLSDLQPAGKKLARAVLGGSLGLLPGIAFIAAVMATLEGDESQLGFLGIPIGLAGLVGGAAIGWRWVPRRVMGLPPPPREREPV